jgi:prolyl oligopeptidase
MPLAANSTVNISGVTGKADMAFATVEGMLTPPTLYAVSRARPPPSCRAFQPSSTPAICSRAALCHVEGRNQVPYFLVRKRGAKSRARR